MANTNDGPAKLRAARAKRGLSQHKLGILLGCTGQYVGLMENGKLPSIGLELAFAIERELGIPAETWLKVAA